MSATMLGRDASAGSDYFVSVETGLERKVREIGLDGTEIYQPAPSVDEHFDKLISRYDFSESLGKTKELDLVSTPPASPPPSDAPSSTLTSPSKEKSTLSKDDEEDTTVPRNWSKESLRASLLSALTEVTALTDLLAVAGQSTYLKVAHVHSHLPGVTHHTNFPVEQPESDQTHDHTSTSAGGAVNFDLLHSLKHKALIRVGNHLTSSAVSLRSAYETNADHRRLALLELKDLRQCYKIWKTHSGQLVGEVSFGSSGSRYPHRATFEVIIKKHPPVDASHSRLEIVVPPEFSIPTFLKIEFHPNAGSTPDNLEISRKVVQQQNIERRLLDGDINEARLLADLASVIKTSFPDNTPATLHADNQPLPSPKSTQRVIEQPCDLVTSNRPWFQTLAKMQTSLLAEEIMSHLLHEVSTGEFSARCGLPVGTFKNKVVVTLDPNAPEYDLSARLVIEISPVTESKSAVATSSEQTLHLFLLHEILQKHKTSGLPRKTLLSTQNWEACKQTPSQFWSFAQGRTQEKFPFSSPTLSRTDVTPRDANIPLLTKTACLARHRRVTSQYLNFVTEIARSRINCADHKLTVQVLPTGGSPFVTGIKCTASFPIPQLGSPVFFFVKIDSSFPYTNPAFLETQTIPPPRISVSMKESPAVSICDTAQLSNLIQLHLQDVLLEICSRLLTASSWTSLATSHHAFRADIGGDRFSTFKTLSALSPDEKFELTISFGGDLPVPTFTMVDLTKNKSTKRTIRCDRHFGVFQTCQLLLAQTK